MASVSLGVSTASTTNATSYASGSFTPAANDLLVVFVTCSATVSTAAALTDSQGLGFTKVTSALWQSSGSTSWCFVANARAAASAMTVTFDCSDDAATGCVIQVVRIAGPIVKTGLAAIVQSAKQENIGTSSTPAPAFGASVSTSNPTIGLVSNNLNPAAMTPPASWTELDDSGYNTPAVGGEVVSRDSGFTGTTITWGSVIGGANPGAAIIVEINALKNVDADGSSAGVASSGVAGDAIWRVVGNATGTGTAAAEGEDGSIVTGIVARDGNASGVATSSVVGRALWDSAASATGAASQSVVGVGVRAGVAASTGTSTASAVMRRFTKTHDEVFGQPLDDPTCDLHWDTYTPDASASGSGPYPVCIFIHVGRFQSGGPSGDSNLVTAAKDMADAGYFAVSIEHRRAINPITGQTTDGLFPKQAVDCKMALDAARVDVRGNGKVVIIGGSSGGTHATMLCIGWNTGTRPYGAVCLSPVTKFDDRTDMGPNVIDAVQDYTNTIDDPAGLAAQLAASPVTFVDSAAKPMFLFNATTEEMPQAQLTDMTTALAAAGVTNYQSQIVAGAGHAFENWATVKDTAIAFLNGLVAVTEGTGSASGSATATGVGGATKGAAGSAAGTGTAAANTGTVKAAIAGSAGTGTAAATASSTAGVVGASAGLGVAAATGTAIKPAVASSTGAGTAAANSAIVRAGDGSAAGTAGATAQASALALTVFQSAGSGAASADGSNAAATGSDASAIGTSTAAANATAIRSAVATSAGVGSASVNSATARAGTGSATGTGTAAGQMTAFIITVFQSSGSGAASAAGSNAAATGADATSAGTSTATGAVAYRTGVVFFAAGSSTVDGQGEVGALLERVFLIVTGVAAKTTLQIGGVATKIIMTIKEL